MNSTPASILVPVLVITSSIIGARWVLLRGSTIDRLLNRALTWSVGGVFAYGVAEWLGFPELAPQLFITSGLLAMANVYGLARLLDSGDTAKAAGRLRTYHWVAVIFAGVPFLAVSPIGQALSVDRILDWYAMVWIAADVVIAVSVVLIVRACARELRRSGNTVQERLTYSSLLVLACFSGALTIAALINIATGNPPTEPGAAGSVGAFVCLLLYAVLVAIPLFNVALERAGLDRASRDCRRLLPMWLDLTAAVPEVVLDQQLDRPDPAARRYRMMVEISDALLQLRRLDAESSRAANAADDRVTLARRVPALVRTDFPEDGDLRGEPRQRAVESRMLLELAREWPALRHRADAPAPVLRRRRLGSARLYPVLGLSTRRDAESPQ
ncbi:DUF6545 domain-containing protein [Nocardia amikacinitolerans]|uniref:DUF6545 domain-containing protein n=1 Tax=Nocardia amikacinitolerans TaxID=756689 RepID=UPI0020A4E5F2|nr:DUF6545 domain-containing protein [Nocardia amikacinitolerans]MCP2289370.1 hypothetical protein [Nocardia amikacinitolerans]